MQLWLPFLLGVEYNPFVNIWLRYVSTSLQSFLIEKAMELTIELITILLTIYIFVKVNPCNHVVFKSNFVKRAELRLLYVSIYINSTSLIRNVVDLIIAYMDLNGYVFDGLIFWYIG